jgi:hypothetical protein
MKRELYHGGLEIITEPEIREANRTLDFGVGFYLTSSLHQAEDWVRRRMDDRKAELGYVNAYDFEEDEAMALLRVKYFDYPSDEWVDFVMSNRRTPGFTHDYDIVIGPVANDRVYTAFTLYEGGIIDKATLILELKTYRLIDQYLFHTPRSLSFLTYSYAKKIRL